MSNNERLLSGPATTRREMLSRSGMGFGAMGLSWLLGKTGLASDSPGSGQGRSLSALAQKTPPLRPRAKRVIHLFMNGGPSHVDTFDPKPMLAKYAGKPLPFEGGNLPTERKTGAAFPSPFKFHKYGQSGIEVSEIFSRVGSCIDDIAVIRSMQAEVPNHEPSLMLMNCGDSVRARPSVGAWVTYGLGTENQNLPGFIAFCPGGFPIKDSDNWRSGFLPSVYQGTYIDPKHTQIEQLIEHIKNKNVPLAEQRRQLDLLTRIEQEYRKTRKADTDLDARIQSFELAYRMQTEAAEAFDVDREPDHIRKLYGSGVHARQTLIARRLIERGVRFVQLWHGAGQPWDSHNDIAKHHRKLAGECDQAIAALLTDLKQRGLLDETLVIWGGEFGRTPTVELNLNGSEKMGRDHNPYGFSMWLAGGGIKGGTVYGATDEFGFAAVQNKVHVHDLHATILYLLGFDHENFTFRYAGRDFRLTDVGGNVIPDIIA